MVFSVPSAVLSVMSICSGTTAPRAWSIAHQSASDACDYILGKGVFADFERPISAACALGNADGSFDTFFK